MKYTITISDMDENEFNSTVSKLTTEGNWSLSKLEAAVKSEPQPKFEIQDKEVNESSDELDINGLPWDERIHSSNRKKNKDGSWQKRRGVDEEVVKEVAGELMAETAPEMPVTQEVQVETPVEPVAQAVNLEEWKQPEIPAMPVQQPETPAIPVTQPAPVASTTPKDFNSLIARIQAAIQSGEGVQYLQKVVTELNIAFTTNMNAITDIMGNQAMIEYAFTILEKDGK